MDITKLLVIAGAVFAEVKGDLVDGKLTVDEVIGVAQTVIDKLGYGKEVIWQFGDSTDVTNLKPIAGAAVNLGAPNVGIKN